MGEWRFSTYEADFEVVFKNMVSTRDYRIPTPDGWADAFGPYAFIKLWEVTLSPYPIRWAAWGSDWVEAEAESRYDGSQYLLLSSADVAPVGFAIQPKDSLLFWATAIASIEFLGMTEIQQHYSRAFTYFVEEGTQAELAQVRRWVGHLLQQASPELQVAVDRALEAQQNPKDLKGRYIPEKYLRGLNKTQRRQRIKELTRARDGEKGFRELPTDKAARKAGIVKKGPYTKAAERRGIEYNGDFEDTARRALRYYGVRATQKRVSAVAKELQKVYKKGLAAWQTGGHRPGASQQAWGYARINSLLTGGKTYWTADKKNAAQFPVQLRKAIEAERTWGS